jgi:hypothetical protein
LQLADLLNLVVVNSKGLVLHQGVVQFLFSRGGLIWLLEADESIEFLLLVSGVESQTLNLTVGFKLMT